MQKSTTVIHPVCEAAILKVRLLDSNNLSAPRKEEFLSLQCESKQNFNYLFKEKPFANRALKKIRPEYSAKNYMDLFLMSQLKLRRVLI